MCRAIVLAAVAALMVVSVPRAGAAEGVRTLACTSHSDQSIGTFADVFDDAGSVVVGPLALTGLRGVSTASPEVLERVGGFKSPLLLRPGRSAVVSIDPASRSSIRLTYGGGDRSNLASLPHTVRFKACSARHSRSRAGGHRVTFWAGLFAFKPDTPCLRFTITVNGRKRHQLLPIAGGDCRPRR